MTKYFILSFIFVYSINANADMCDSQFWEDPSREEIDSFLFQGEVGLDNSNQTVDALFEDCENGRKPIEIASETASHAIITYLLCKVAVNAVFNETLPYLISHFRDDHEGQFNLGVYVTVSLPEIGGITGLTIQASSCYCETRIFQ